MEVRLNADLEAKLSRMAAEQGRPTETLVQEAVERLVDYDEWFLREVEIGKAAADRGESDDGSRYYHYWLAALEHLVTAKGLADPAALSARKEAWADAYRHTPHGKPVELGAGAGHIPACRPSDAT